MDEARIRPAAVGDDRMTLPINDPADAVSALLAALHAQEAQLHTIGATLKELEAKLADAHQAFTENLKH